MSKEMYFALRKFFQSSLFEEANVSSPSRESFLLGIHVRPASSLSRILYERIVFRMFISLIILLVCSWWKDWLRIVRLIEGNIVEN